VFRPNTTNINFGVLHPGNGTAWFDSLAVELDGTRYTDTTLFDFDFESSVPKGFSTGGAGFSVQLDASAAHTGKQSLRRTYSGGPTLSSAEIAAQCAGVVAHMESSRDAYLSRDFTKEEIVLWAHDYHVSRSDGAMGSYLAKRYGKDYVVLGFGFHEGSYNANGAQGLKALRRRSRKAAPDQPGSAWLLDDVQFRTIGSVPVDGFATTRLVHDYDVMIYFDHSSPSMLLPF
jgi:hypothetical protein